MEIGVRHVGPSEMRGAERGLALGYGVNMVTLQIMVLTRFFELTRVLIEHVFWADTLF